jgi:DNA-directed RNA polymerase subunit alpha
VTIVRKGEGPVTASDIVSGDGRVDVLNPDQHLATLTADAELRMTLAVKVGKGYSLAENNKDEDAPVGTIAIDAVFSHPLEVANDRIAHSRTEDLSDTAIGVTKLSIETFVLAEFR